MGNNEIENAAIDWVIEYERAAGRTPVNTHNQRGAPTDISSPPRLIEVKSFGQTCRGQDLPFETPKVEAAEQDDNFYLYVVENVAQGDPAKFTLKVLDAAYVRRLLQRKKEYGYFGVPWSASDYDNTPYEPCGRYAAGVT